MSRLRLYKRRVPEYYVKIKHYLRHENKVNGKKHYHTVRDIYGLYFTMLLSKVIDFEFAVYIIFITYIFVHIDSLVEDYGNSMAIALELQQSCTTPSLCSQY